MLSALQGEMGWGGAGGRDHALKLKESSGQQVTRCPAESSESHKSWGRGCDVGRMRLGTGGGGSIHSGGSQDTCVPVSLCLLLEGPRLGIQWS